MTTAKFISRNPCGTCQFRQVEEWVAYSPCDCLPPIRNVVHTVPKVACLWEKKLYSENSAKLVYNSMYGEVCSVDWRGSFRIGSTNHHQRMRQRILMHASHPGGSDLSPGLQQTGFLDSRHPTLSLSNRIGVWEEAQAMENLTRSSRECTGTTRLGS